jgi:hypothetical protein
VHRQTARIPRIAARHAAPRPHAIAELNAIVVRAGQIDPRERYASADAMRADLSCCKQDIGHASAGERGWKRAKSLGCLQLCRRQCGSDLGAAQLNRNRPLSTNREALNLESKYCAKPTLKELL